MRKDELLHFGVHHFAPAAAAENAVVPCTFSFVMHALVFGNACAQVMGSRCLARTGDVVQFAFNSHQCCGLDVLRTNTFNLAFGVDDIPGAIDQLELAEHGLNGLQVVVGVHVEHSVVLVIELPVCLRAFLVALDQVFEVIVVAAQMVVRVHGHKAGVLQEAWVHPATGTWEGAGHAENDVVLKPFDAALRGQVVDGRGRFAGVNGAAHHGHGQWCGLTTAGHQRHGRQYGYGGLTHTHDVAVAILALQVADEFLYMVDVVIQVKFAIFQRHQAGVFPVGDVDLVVLQHRFDRVAQQCGVVTRQRSHNQHGGLVLQFFQCGRVV